MAANSRTAEAISDTNHSTKRKLRKTKREKEKAQLFVILFVYCLFSFNKFPASNKEENCHLKVI
jgi:hypothetical protein